ncbi:thioredoxin domain-containing protein [Sphingomonas sp.]|uniref:thioredoxin domain-containing protein n=1 Tax=Sphingomonas sp. TaxID=28214 RepID=UPI001D5EEBEF|nr:thioredoxin domain-containing protein [Sphingomonas sp.]MBX9797326.1 DsbA family protein [Sphingomonas sp.]
MISRTLMAFTLAGALAACGGAGGDTGSAPAAPVAGKAPPAGKQWTETVSTTAEGGYVMGNPDAPVKLIEYGSRACPVCARFDAEGFPALKAGPIAAGKLSYEFREYPVHGALDIAPILLGQCVGTEAFFPMLDEMFKAQPQLLAKANEVAQAIGAQQMTPNQTAITFAEQLGYLDFVKQRGVPEAQARACLSDPARIDAIVKRFEAANKKYSVAGTPTFVLNGKVVDNTTDWATLKPKLAAAGAGV